jgi:hypothetical protein
LKVGALIAIFLDNLSPEDVLILTNTIAVSLSKNKTALEIGVLGTFIGSIGTLMTTMAAQQAYINSLQQANQSTPQEEIII